MLAGLPDGVEAVRREGPGGSHLFLLNHGGGPVTVTVPEGSAVRFGDGALEGVSLSLPAHGVSVVGEAVQIPKSKKQEAM